MDLRATALNLLCSLPQPPDPGGTPRLVTAETAKGIARELQNSRPPLQPLSDPTVVQLRRDVADAQRAYEAARTACCNLSRDYDPFSDEEEPPEDRHLRTTAHHLTTTRKALQTYLLEQQRAFNYVEGDGSGQ